MKFCYFGAKEGVLKHLLKKFYVEGDEQIIEKKEGCTLVEKRYPISYFFNKDSSVSRLDDFAKIVNDNTSRTEKLF